MLLGFATSAGNNYMAESPIGAQAAVPPRPGIMTRLRASRSIAMVGKLAFIAIIVYFLLGAIYMVRALVYEREARADQVSQEIARLWGQPQIVRGPVLAVPYGVPGDIPGAEYAEVQGIAYFLPRTLELRGELVPEVRSRGLFDTAVYTFAANVRGTFARPSVESLRGRVEKSEEMVLLWDRADVLVGLSDLRGMRSNVELQFGGEMFSFRPGLRASSRYVPSSWRTPFFQRSSRLRAWTITLSSSAPASSTRRRLNLAGPRGSSRTVDLRSGGTRHVILRSSSSVSSRSLYSSVGFTRRM